MTNSQKAFEENKKRLADNSIFLNSTVSVVWKLAWDARGKFDEEVCASISFDPESDNDDADLHDFIHHTTDEIRKRGGE